MSDNHAKEDNMEESSAKDTPFSKVIQIGVVVRDMDKTIERLSSLGIGPFKPKMLPPDREEWFRDKPLDAILKLSSTMIGEVELELIQPVAGESPHKEFLDSKGEGIQHIACAVSDVDKEVAKLTKQGVGVLLRAKGQDWGVAYLDIGVAGLIIELIQRK
jgi:methylmalonyl-CoA/ethylmalonyl-CoA epimerase